jgi:hypothetical protein
LSNPRHFQTVAIAIAGCAVVAEALRSFQQLSGFSIWHFYQKALFTSRLSDVRL